MRQWCEGPRRVGASGIALIGLVGRTAREECPGPTPLDLPKQLSVHEPGEEKCDKKKNGTRTD